MTRDDLQIEHQSADELMSCIAGTRIKGGVETEDGQRVRVHVQCEPETLWSGRTIITGHLHAQGIRPHSDYNGTRWGVDAGTMADPLRAAVQPLHRDESP